MSSTPKPPKPPKPDHLRRPSSRSPLRLPDRSTVVPARKPSSNAAYTTCGSRILADTLEALGPDDRELISTLLLPTNAISVDAAFNELHACTKELQKRCAIKRWSWNYKGRRVYLFDQVDKVMQLLDKFKAAGDVAANVDPVHVGLPWAGIRIILEVALTDSHQRAVLVTGIELALYMSNRLKIYLDICAHSSPSLSTDSFRKSLVNLYVHILTFLARAIRAQRRRSVVRVLQALWDSSALIEFEEECDKLCIRASEEARICDSRASLEAHLHTMDGIYKVHTSVTKLEDKVDLGKLETAKEATYNSSTEGELSQCLPNTRTDLLEQIAYWAADQAGKRIFWLCGKAGTGKSTVSRTVAQRLDDAGLLAASFFFRRGRADRSHARLLFPTIARQLADLFPDIAHAIAASLDQDSLLCDKYLSIQFERLLLQPLQRVDPASIPSAGVALVIDALDECDNSESIRTTLLLLARVEAITSIRLRIFVTSRPELPVELGFQDMSRNFYHDVRLEEAQETSITHDIRVFYEHQFTEIRKYSLLYDDDLPDGWPGEQSTRTLVNQAVPLFIFASTVSRYISADPKRNLAIMLQQSRDKSLTGLKGTYLPILDQVVACEGDANQMERILDFKRIVGSIILLYDPLSTSALALLLGVQAGDVGRVLRPLHSVLNIPRALNGKTNRTKPITLFHLSFRDFLIDSELKKENVFWVKPNERHGALGMHCIKLLESGGLKENICGVATPGIRRSEVAKSAVHVSLPEAVAYACRYLVKHVVESDERIKDDGVVHRFLKKHLLHWMEALSWLGMMSDVIQILNALQVIVDIDQGKQLFSFLKDANRFVLRNRYIIDEAPMQTYMSSLLFAPATSSLRQTFGDSFGTCFNLMPRVPNRWGPEVQKYEGHFDVVLGVVFSQDGKTLASGSGDKTVRLWDAATGEEKQKLEGHDGAVKAVAFSPDGKTVASGSGDKTVRLWDAATGEERQKLEGHDGEVSAVAFSPDGKTVASGSGDKTVRLWDAATGEERQKLEGHDGEVSAVAFSPDGKTVASGSDDKTVRLWDAATGEERQKLEGHNHWVSAVTFSPDGNTVASTSNDKTVRLWDATTGEEKQRLEGHNGNVAAVAFSSDGKMVASGSWDKTIRLWDATIGKERQRLEGHEEDVTAVAFSPNSKAIASGSFDSTVRLWDVAASEEKEKLQGHDLKVTAAVFSPDGRTVASASYDHTVRLWDAETGGEGHRLIGHQNCVSMVIFSPNGKTVASGSWDGTVKLWDVATGKERQKLQTPSLIVLAFSPDSKTVALGSVVNTVILWDAATGDERQKFEGHHSDISVVAFSLDGKTVASGSCDKTVRLWDIATGEERQKLEGHDHWVSAVVFSSDGKTVASGSWDKTIRLWDATTGKERQRLEGHKENVTAVVFSPDGNTVASASNDKTVRLWDATTGEEKQKHQFPRNVSRIAFSIDGRSLETDFGQLDLGSAPNAHLASITKPKFKLLLESSWIKYCGADFLWLPHEYRGMCQDAHGLSLAIGQASGAVSLFSFR